MKKMCFLIILPIVCTISETKENWNEINRIIKTEKVYLLSNKCETDIKIKVDSTFIKYFKNDEFINDTLKFNNILSALKRKCCCYSRYCRTIQEKKICDIVAKLISTTNNENMLYKMIKYIYNGNIKYFGSYNKEIKPVLEKYLNRWQLAKEMLLRFELKENEKDYLKDKLSIYYKSGYPYYIRILLGEKEAQDTLLQMYEKETDFEKLKKLIEQLELAGTKRCEMALVNSLGTKDQEQHSRSYSYSIRYFIIQALGKLNPQSTILNDDLYDYKELIGENPFNDELKSKLTKEYFNNLYDYIETHYNKKINELKNATFLYSFCITKTPIDLDDVKKDKLR